MFNATECTKYKPISLNIKPIKRQKKYLIIMERVKGRDILTLLACSYLRNSKDERLIIQRCDKPRNIPIINIVYLIITSITNH